MGSRFSRRIKICKGVNLNISKSGIGVSLGAKGMSVSTGSRGDYVNLGLSGTGISYRERIDADKKVISESDITPQDYIEGSVLKIQIDDSGNELLYMQAPDGTVFINESMLRKVKRSDTYKEVLETTRKAKYDIIKQENDNCVEIYKRSPPIITEEDVVKERNNPTEIQQQFYKMRNFLEPEPFPSSFHDDAYKWACENVKNAHFWNKKKLINEATQTKQQELFDKAKTEWNNRKEMFLANERNIKDQKNKEYEEDYNRQIAERAKMQELILNPDDNYILETVKNILEQIELPVDFSIDYNVSDREIELDLDLPEYRRFSTNNMFYFSKWKAFNKKENYYRVK